MSFEDFVRRVAEIPDVESNTHFRAMHPFLTHKGCLLPYTLCRLENLASDWNVVQQNVPGFPCLPKMNQSSVSGRLLYSDAYSSELAEIAYERYHKDIELLGYEEGIKGMISSLKKKGTNRQ